MDKNECSNPVPDGIRIEEKQTQIKIQNQHGIDAVRLVDPSIMMKVAGVFDRAKIASAKAICIEGVWYERALFPDRCEAEWEGP